MRRDSAFQLVLVLCCAFASAQAQWAFSPSVSVPLKPQAILYHPGLQRVYYAADHQIGYVSASLTAPPSPVNITAGSIARLHADSSYFYVLPQQSVGSHTIIRVDLDLTTPPIERTYSTSSAFSTIVGSALDASGTLYILGHDNTGNAFLHFSLNNFANISYVQEIEVNTTGPQPLFTAVAFDLSQGRAYACTSGTGSAVYALNLTAVSANGADAVIRSVGLGVPDNITVVAAALDLSRGVAYFVANPSPSAPTVIPPALLITFDLNSFTSTRAYSFYSNDLRATDVALDTVVGQLYVSFDGGQTSSRMGHVSLANLTLLDDGAFLLGRTRITSLSYYNGSMFAGTSNNAQAYSILQITPPPPCPLNCKGRGVCIYGVCDCTVPSTTQFPGSLAFAGADCGQVLCTTNCFSNNSQGFCNLFVDGLCVCTDDYTGTDCSTRRCPNDCAFHGACDTTTWTCTCEKGYAGRDCGTYTATAPCDQLLSCDECSTNSTCGWCESEGRCVAGDIVGPQYGTCLNYFYAACPEYGMIFWPYLFSAIAAFMLLVDIVSIFRDDLAQPYGKPSDAQLRTSWWRNQRSAKTWLLVEEIQFASIMSMFAVNGAPLLESFLTVFRWAAIGFPLPWNVHTADRGSARDLLSLSQYASAVGAFEEELLFGQLFWLAVLTLLCLAVMGIMWMVSRCHPNENMKKFVRLRTVYMLLRIALFAYLPLAVTASYSIVLGGIGTIVVGAIVLAALVAFPLWLFFLLPRSSSRDVKDRARIFDSEFIMKYGCLFIPYQFRQSWYMIMILLRKLALGCILGFLARQELAQIIVLLVIQFVYLLQLFFVKPYLDAIHMIVDFLLTCVNFVAISFMLVFLTHFDASYTAQGVLGVGVAVLLLSGMIIAVSAFVDSWLKMNGIYTWSQLVDRCRGRTSAADQDQDLELQGTRKAD